MLAKLLEPWELPLLTRLGALYSAHVFLFLLMLYEILQTEGTEIGLDVTMIEQRSTLFISIYSVYELLNLATMFPQQSSAIVQPSDFTTMRTAMKAA